MHQWVDESSRDHHYSASINTFIRKFIGGLDQPRGSIAWEVVRCKPDAARYPDLLGEASASLESRRGTVSSTPPHLKQIHNAFCNIRAIYNFYFFFDSSLRRMLMSDGGDNVQRL